MDIYQKLGQEADAALDANNSSDIEDVLAKIEAALAEGYGEDSILLYYRANCFAGLRQIRRTGAEDHFEWRQPELSQEILSLRRSIRSGGFAKLDRIRRCQILTNLGNALNTVGRPIEAIAAWDEALRIEPRFAMAAANRAYGLSHYSAALYDAGHQCVFLMEAADGFKRALSDNAIFESNYPDSHKVHFREKLTQIEEYLKACCKLDNFDPHSFELGDNDEAIALNRWRLENRLFLNPLNDLGVWPIAVQDVFHLPDHSYSIEDKPVYPQYFDLLKQEYVAACVLFYESLATLEYVHPADKTLLTFEHGDCSVTSVQIEKRKSAFRIAYSLLDKCSVFVNDYFALGHNPRSPVTSFRSIWYKEREKKTLHQNLPQENWRLRGLYAISLDLFDEDFKEVSSPVAMTVNDARNAAEHRFLSIHDSYKPDDPDPCLERLMLEELTDLTMQGLKLSRATIMGLSLAVHHHEKFIREPAGDKFVVPIVAIPKKR